MIPKTFRKATRSELDLAVSWAASEGWNPGRNDAEVFWQTDPEGFVCIEQEGQVIGTGSIVSYGGKFGFMGFFIVREDFRGQGIGRDFWNWRRDRLFSRLDPGAAIGMDGVFAMQDFYSKGGFHFSHRNLRMQGTAGSFAPDPKLVPLTELPFDMVTACDRLHFGFARDTFLKTWIQPDGGASLGLVENGVLVAMGVVRPCLTGYKIGPLFADSAGSAKIIFEGLSNCATGKPIFLDTPENNPGALALATRYGLEEVFGCARMYYGNAPELPWQNIYGITTFELG